MLDFFSITLAQSEVAFLRQALDVVSVSGKDAKFLANLQVKLEGELASIDELKKQEEIKKQTEMQRIMQQEQTKMLDNKFA